jgi:hypothetical protein
MQEAKMSFETGVAQCDTGEWCWAARGRDLPEFFQSCDPSYVPTSTGWFLFGPYTTEGAARRELREFVDEFFRDAQPAEDTSPGQPRWQRALEQGEVRLPPQERGSCWP